jgi:hypothetical protein
VAGAVHRLNPLLSHYVCLLQAIFASKSTVSANESSWDSLFALVKSLGILNLLVSPDLIIEYCKMHNHLR